MRRVAVRWEVMVSVAAGFGFAAEDEGTRGEDGGEVLGEIVIDGDFVRLGGFVAWGSPAVDEGAVVA
jgi:hypothetical protein